MNSLMARRFSFSIVAVALLALLFAAGCTTGSPVPTRTPDPTVPGIEPGAPAGTVAPARPTPTRLAPASSPTVPPAPAEPTAPPTVEGLASLNYGESDFLAALASLPLEFEERGIWFSNPKQSLDVAGASRPADLEEFLSLPGDQRKRYVRNSGGAVSSLLGTVSQTVADWEDAYGFSIFQVDAITVTGMDNFKPLETNYLTGEFDEEAIVRSLADLGYRAESVGDDVYYAIREDFRQDLSLTNPATRLALGSANRIFVGDNFLVVSPDTPPVLQVIRARNGEVPTLVDSPAFASIAAGLSDPLTAALLTREATLDPEIGVPPDKVPGSRDRPEEWEVMHEWEAFGSGFSKTPDTTALRFSLYYPHRDWAGLDAETLVERIESYMTRLAEVSQLDQVCESWSPLARVYGNGSTLTVTCQIPTGDESAYLQGGVTRLVPMRLLGFLAP